MHMRGLAPAGVATRHGVVPRLAVSERSLPRKAARRSFKANASVAATRTSGIKLDAHRAARLGTSLGSSRSGTYGQPPAIGAPLRSVKGARPYISAAAYRRGNTLVVCATLAGVEDATDVGELLARPIKRNADLVTGELQNGLKYVILPNKTPPTRFEAHLEIHAGSVDELEHEQGVAHLVEHVTFLGSRRREALLGTGARSNAYTDFHHTVFHVHAPLLNGITGQPMLPRVLEALQEIAFEPQFLPMRIEKERKAVLAEAQMMNTIEYRVDCQLLQHMHDDNNLGCRFPIGKTDQIKTWPHEVLQGYWSKWYFPANATLYIVGDLDRSPAEVERLIQDTFGKMPPGREPLPLNGNGNGNGAVYDVVAETTSASAPAAGAATASTAVAVPEGPLKQRHAVRPPVKHKHGCGPLQPGEGPADVRIFRHPLLQQFMLSIFCKLPIRSMKRMDDLRRMFIIRIILSTYQFRMNARYVAADPPFTAIELDISDSGREGCAVSTLTISSEPKDWRGAVEVAVQEARRLQRHGITPGELQRYKKAMLRDSAQLSQQANSIPSIDSLDFVMENIALGHIIMGHADAHEAMTEVADTITVEDVNQVARSMLSFASDYGHDQRMLDEAARNPELYAPPGPTRATCVVACIPAFTDASGGSLSGGAPTMRGANMGAMGHLDADTIDLAALEQQSQKQDDVEIPEGAQRFELSPEEIAEALADDDLDVTATTDIDIIEHLIPPERLEELIAEAQPRYVPLGGEGTSGDPLAPADPHTGVVQRRLSNGIRINYRHTDNEPKAGLMRMAASGGRAAEKAGAAPDGSGAVTVGTRALSESGTVADYQREEVEVFCISNLVDCVVQADEEFIVMDLHYAVGDGGLEAAFELLHLFLAQPKWDPAALERAKQIYLSSLRSVEKSLDRASADRIMQAMHGPDRRFRDPAREEVEALTLEGCRSEVEAQLHPSNIEINVVGDFDAAELEELCLAYLGTIPGRPNPRPIGNRPVVLCNPGPELRNQRWHLPDSDERACAYIAGPAPCRWGPFGSQEPLSKLEGPVVPPLLLPSNASPQERAHALEVRRNHPLFSSVVLLLLTEIINSRLFTTVRDSLGLTYDVNFEVTLYDRLRTGWFSVNVTSYPDKIHDALAASLSVLRQLKTSSVTPKELMRAKRTLMTRHESDLKDNSYWVGLMTHLQNDSVPLKDIQCLRDLKLVYESIAQEDINYVCSFFNFDDDSIFRCIGTSGKAPPPEPSSSSATAYLETDDVESFVRDGSAGAPDGADVNPMALLTAWMAAAKGADLASAFKKYSKPGDSEQQQQQQQQQRQKQ